MNKRENLVAIMELVRDNAEYVAFLENEIAKIDNRKAKEKEKRAERVGEAGAIIRDDAVKVLENAGRPITLAELVAGITLIDKTPNKVIYHIRPLVEDGTIVKAKVKIDDRKLTTYALA